MLRLVLVRHGQCDMNLALATTVGGRASNSPLTALGRTQALQLGQFWLQKGYKPDKVFASTAVRAIHTAQLACAQIGISSDQIQIFPELEELDQGEWEGKPRSECYTQEVVALLDKDGYTFKPPGGESQQDLENRMVAFVEKHIIDRLQDQGCDDSVALFGHSLAIKVFWRYVFGAAKQVTYKHVLDNTGLVTLLYHKKTKSWHMQGFNTTDHLTELNSHTNNV